VATRRASTISFPDDSYPPEIAGIAIHHKLIAKVGKFLSGKTWSLGFYMPNKKPTPSKSALRTLALSSALLFVGNPLFAGTIGLNAAPLGDHSDSTIKFALFDTFNQSQITAAPNPTFSFSGNADASSTLTGISLVQSAAHITALGSGSAAQGAGLLNAALASLTSNADIYYSSTKAQSWTLKATAAVEAKEISFQIKVANITSDTNAHVLFQPTLTGVGPATYVTHAPTGEPPLFGQAVYVIEYRWTGLSIPAGTPLNITFGIAGGNSPAEGTRKPVDFIALDVKGNYFEVTPAVTFGGAPFTAKFASIETANTPLTYGVYKVVNNVETVLVAPSDNAAPPVTLLPTNATTAATYQLRGKIFNSLGEVIYTRDQTVIATPADKKAPTISITKTTPSAATTLAGTVVEDVALSSFTATLNGLPLTFTTKPAFGASTAATGAWTIANVLPQNGSNTLVVEATDYSGKIARATQTFNFVNTTLSARAGTYNAILIPSSAGTVDTVGLATITVGTSGSFTGKVTLGGVAIPISGVLQNNGVARFKPALGTSFDLIDKTEFDSYLGSIVLSVNESNQLVGTLSTQAVGGTTLGGFTSVAAGVYNSTTPVPVTFLNQPAAAPVKGVYTVAFPSKAQSPGLDASLYPQGAGYATVTISNTGSVSYSGFLADGTKLSGATKLNSNGTAPLFAQLYKKNGAIAGLLNFSSTPLNSDVTATNLLWVRPVQSRARYYPAGWSLKVDAIGTKYAAPASLDFGQDVADPVNGNASLVFSAGGLASTITKVVSINPGPVSTGQVKLIPAANAPYKFSLTGSTGVFSGTVTHDGVTDSYRGALLNKGTTKAGYGYFLSTPAFGYNVTGQAGNVSLNP